MDLDSRVEQIIIAAIVTLPAVIATVVTAIRAGKIVVGLEQLRAVFSMRELINQLGEKQMETVQSVDALGAVKASLEKAQTLLGDLKRGLGMGNQVKAEDLDKFGESVEAALVGIKAMHDKLVPPPGSASMVPPEPEQ